MILIGTCVSGEGQRYREVALPGINMAKGPEDIVRAIPGHLGIAAVYNELCDLASSLPTCEALVLMHDDVRVVDRNFRGKVLSAVEQDGQLAVIGVVGGSDLTSTEWWKGRRAVGRVHETRKVIEFPERRGPVDVVDGLLLVLSPLAFNNLRFDEQACPKFHGYDVDICLSAREKGWSVVVLPLDVVHHTRGGYGDKEAYDAAHKALAAKWARYIRPYTPREQAERRVKRDIRRGRRVVRKAIDFGQRIGRGIKRSERSEPSEESVATPNVDVVTREKCPVCAASLREASTRARVLVCAECGLGVTVPSPARDVTGDGLWVQMYAGNRLDVRHQWFHEAEQRLAWVELFEPEGLLLEVGCGTGEFVKVAERAGFDAFGVEPSKWAAQHAADLGTRITVGYLDDWSRSYKGVRPDIIALWHVLEHVPDPLALLREIATLLRPGGLAVLEVPNFASVGATELGVDWNGLQPNDHYVQFTPGSIERAMLTSGLLPIEILPISTRVYAPLHRWLEERNGALIGNRTWPSGDLLRVAARAPGDRRGSPSLG